MIRRVGVSMALLASLMVGVASPAEARELNPYQLRALYRLYVTATYKAQTGDWAGALKDFQAAANLAPRSAEILLQLARAYYHTSQIKQAERYAHLALEADSSASEAYVILGEIALAAEDAAAADSYFSQRLRWEPNDDQTRLRLGFLREEAGDLEGVVEVLTDFPPQRRGAATAHYHRGLALVRLGRYDEAISAFRTVVNLVPDHTDSYRFLALLEEQQGRDEEALEDWGTVLNLDPNNIQALRHRIDLLLERNRVKKAREDLLRLSRLTAGDSGGVDPDALLYQYAMEEGNYGAAARALLRVARKKNAGETTFLQAALLASRGEGDTEIVIEALEGAYRVSGKEALGHLAARTYIQAGRETEAAALLKKMLVSDPRDTTALWIRGLLLGDLGDRDGAVEMFLRYLEIDPDNATVLNYVGYTWAEQGVNLDRAEGLIKRALVLDPENPEYLDSLGWVYFQKGAYELARAYLERAARRDTNEPVILEHLGDAYERLGRLKEARVFYEKALAAAKKMPPRPDIDIPRLKRKLLKLASENGVVAAERP